MDTSVVIISRDRKDELLRCIDSICGQSGIGKDIILIDNASRQSISSYIAPCIYGEASLRISRTEKKLGISAARNLGFEMALSDIVYFIDDDAFLPNDPYALQKAVKIICEQDIPILATDVLNYEFGIHMRGRFKKIAGGTNEQVLFFAGASHFINKKFFKPPLYPETIKFGHEDLYLSLSAYQRGLTVRYLDCMHVMHQMSEKRDETYGEIKAASIVNKYAVKSAFFPAVYRPFLVFGLWNRCIRFYKWDVGGMLESLRTAYRVKKQLTPRRLTYAQAKQLLADYGRDFLWEISSSGVNRDIEHKRKRGVRDLSEEKS